MQTKFPSAKDFTPANDAQTVPSSPKARYVLTQGYGFNAATTQIIRLAEKTLTA